MDISNVKTNCSYKKPRTKILKTGKPLEVKKESHSIPVAGQSPVVTNSDSEQVRFKKVNLTCPNYKETTMVDTGIVYDKYLSIQVSVSVNSVVIEWSPNFTFVTTKGSTGLLVGNLANARFNGNPATLYIQYEG